MSELKENGNDYKELGNTNSISENLNPVGKPPKQKKDRHYRVGFYNEEISSVLRCFLGLLCLMFFILLIKGLVFKVVDVADKETSVNNKPKEWYIRDKDIAKLDKVSVDGKITGRVQVMVKDASGSNNFESIIVDAVKETDKLQGTVSGSAVKVKDESTRTKEKYRHVLWLSKENMEKFKAMKITETLTTKQSDLLNYSSHIWLNQIYMYRLKK